MIPVVMVSALRGAFDLWLSRLDLWRLSQCLLGSCSPKFVKVVFI